MNELLNAGFRYALVRLRDASAAVGLYRGENAERTVLTGRLSAVMDNYGNWRNRIVLFTGWNLSMSQAIDPLPFGVEAVSKSLSIVSQYAHEQKIIPCRYEMDDLFDKGMQALRV